MSLVHLVSSIDEQDPGVRENIVSGNDPDIEYADIFERIGEFLGEYGMQLHLGAEPVIHASRKVPVAIRETVKAELEHMEKHGIITKVTDPTDWVSSMVVVQKRNSNLRVCLNPQRPQQGNGTT